MLVSRYKRNQRPVSFGMAVLWLLMTVLSCSAMSSPVGDLMMSMDSEHGQHMTMPAESTHMEHHESMQGQSMDCCEDTALDCCEPGAEVVPSKDRVSENHSPTLVLVLRQNYAGVSLSRVPRRASLQAMRRQTLAPPPHIFLCRFIA